ncbi:MAG: hypothetical protein NXI21_02120 [Alphaproteobacteria bacterium]|nr:hypothetical protein [Alphaproteobacteria bacterium]
MFGFSFTKLLVLAAVVAAVWYGFKYIGRLDRVQKGERKVGERTFGERLRKATKARADEGGEPGRVEDTEQCPVCKAYVSVEGVENCGRPGCPY